MSYLLDHSPHHHTHTLPFVDYYLVAAVDDGRTLTPIASADSTFKVAARATPAVRHAIAGAFTRLFRR